MLLPYISGNWQVHRLGPNYTPECPQSPGERQTPMGGTGLPVQSGPIASFRRQPGEARGVNGLPELQREPIQANPGKGDPKEDQDKEGEQGQDQPPFSTTKRSP